MHRRERVKANTVTMGTLLGPRKLFVEVLAPRKVEFRTPPRRFDPP